MSATYAWHVRPIVGFLEEKFPDSRTFFPEDGYISSFYDVKCKFLDVKYTFLVVKLTIHVVK